MLAGAQRRIAAFFARPGVTPARVWPVLGVALALPALLVGMQIEPMGQDRASSDAGAPVVVAGGDKTEAAPPADSTTPDSSSGDSLSSDSASTDDSSSGDSAASDSGDSGTLDSEPLAEPSADDSTADDTADDTSDDTTDDESADDAVDDGTAEEFSGTVVRVNNTAHSFTVATENSELIPIHADADMPELGAPIEVKGTPLANGTYKLLGEVTEKEPLEATSFRGYVTWAGGADKPGYTVSNRGVSLFVATEAAVPAPPLGVPVLVNVTLDTATKTLNQSGDVVVEGERTDAPLHIEAIVGAVDTTARTVTLSADDLRETDADIVASVAPDAQNMDLTKLETGRVLDATVVITAEGTYQLTGWSDDSDAEAANDTTLTAGDQIVEEDPAKLLLDAEKLLRELGI